MKANDILIPVKFFLLMTQIILTIVADYTKSNNINSQIDYYKSTILIDFNIELNSLNKLIIAFYVLQIIELVSMFLSFTIFLHKVTAVSIILHGVADLCLCWFIWQYWISEKFIIILIIGSIIPLALELLGILTVVKYRKINQDYKFFY